MKPSNITIDINEDFLKDLDLDNLYKSLKIKGLTFENQANESIQESFSNEKLIQLVSLIVPHFTRLISKVKENQELFSNLMNIPSKNDLASATKLVIETQEKIDALEEQNWQLIDQNKKLLEMNSGHHERMEKLEKERLINETIMQISRGIKE